MYRYIKTLVPVVVFGFGTVATVFAAVSTETNADRPGQDYTHFNSNNAAACRDRCKSANRCKAYTYVKPLRRSTGVCYLKTRVPTKRTNTCCVSGVKSTSTPQARLTQEPIPKRMSKEKTPPKIKSSSQGRLAPRILLARNITANQFKRLPGNQLVKFPNGRRMTVAQIRRERTRKARTYAAKLRAFHIGSKGKFTSLQAALAKSQLAAIERENNKVKARYTRWLKNHPPEVRKKESTKRGSP